MAGPGLGHIVAELKSVDTVRPAGRVSHIAAGLVRVTGLSAHAAMGDRVRLLSNVGSPTEGEVVALGPDDIAILMDGSADGHSTDDRAILLGSDRIAPDASWLGRVIDPSGKALDSRPLLSGTDPRPINRPPDAATGRRGLGARMATGLAVFDTMLPLVRGQRIGLFAGSGVGKSTLLAQLAQGVEADVVVIALVGERGREVRHFIENVLGPRGMEKAVVVAATSDLPALRRRRALGTAMAVAEHFRDGGAHVLLLADSVTRFAEAHREVALAAGEQSSLQGFPPSLPHLVASMAERAGPGSDGQGDITAVFSVLVAGSDMEEPVADMMRGVLDGHVVLDRDIAERGRFPAVDVLRSVSRSLPEAASAEENALISLARRRLGTYDRGALMVQSGLYQAGADPELDAAVSVWPGLDAFIGQASHNGVAASFEALALCLAGGAAGGPGSEG
ncbi:MAG: FliI/YscN family ATPase [Pseudomonadota bacterium]